MKPCRVAVVGATGEVGKSLLDILAERNFPISELVPLASERSAGKTCEFGDQKLTVRDLDGFDFKDTAIAFFSAGGDVSKNYAPKAAAAKCVVIDNTSCFRYEDDIPLVVPEVNPHAIGDYKNRSIIANPNCSTIQMVVALKPLHDVAHIERVNVATYQAISGAGAKAIEEFAQQTVQLLNGESIESEIFPCQMAFNAIPHIDSFQENGYTREEMKIIWETRKIMGEKKLQVNPTCVRIPVFYGHSEAVHIETREKLTSTEAQAILLNAPGVTVIDTHEDGGYPTPVLDATLSDQVFVGRIREDISHPRGLNLWVVADNIRKGAALNSVQIGEMLLQKYL